jgi:hypothetical protein
VGPIEEELNDEANRLRNEITSAIRHSPESFREGARFLDGRYSAEAFNERWKAELAVQKEADRRSREEDIEKLRFEARSNGRRVKPKEVAAIRSRPEPLIVTKFRERRPWCDGDGSDNPYRRLSLALQELSDWTTAMEPHEAQAVCLLVWLISDPTADRFSSKVTVFQGTGWMSDDSNRGSRFVLELGYMTPKLMRAARFAKDYLASIDAWPASEAVQTPAHDLVTLDSAAALTKKSKRTLERWVRDGKLPRPDYPGGGGKAHRWKWLSLREALAKQVGVPLPEQFPGRRLL